MAALFLFLGMFLGVVSIPFGLPGTAIILASMLVYGLYTDFSAAVGLWFFVVMCVLTVIAETADNWLTMLGASRYGASVTSMWVSLIGGLFGAVLIGGPLIPVFGPFGPFAGGLIGAFVAVVASEHRRHRNWVEALRAGWGTFVGRIAGILLKFLIAIVMILAVATSMFTGRANS